jgi:hypothetical protein
MAVVKLLTLIASTGIFLLDRVLTLSNRFLGQRNISLVRRAYSMLLNNLAGRMVILAIFIVVLAAGDPVRADDLSINSAPAVGAKAEPSVALTEMKHGPLTFVPNRGQWDQRAVFRADAGGASIWYTRSAVYFQLSRHNTPPMSAAEPTPQSFRQDNRAQIEHFTYALHIENANPAADIVGESPAEGRVNYFIGNDRRNWRTDIPVFRNIVYHSVYPGIDLRYRGNPDRLEYDFELAPGADPQAISLRFEGVSQVSVSPRGELVITTAWGDLVEQPPQVFQQKGDQRIAISGEYATNGFGSLGFKLGNDYDPSLPTVIDPVLTYSTYLGGAANDIGRGIIVDSSGAVFITGSTGSVNFPTVGAYDPSQNGLNDVFVTKLSPNGQLVGFSTFVGGSGSDEGTSVALTPSGNIIVAGHTGSSDFPTVGAYDGTANGGIDAFVVEIDAAGNNLLYAGYLGGSGDDRAWAVACDNTGRAYVAGETSSSDFPTPSGYDNGLSGAIDGFITCFSASGANLDWGSYLGGSDLDGVYGVAVDNAYTVYLAGYTNSSNFPTVGAYDPTSNFGYDVFVAKLASSGSALTYGTYLGGTGNEWANGIALDAAGNMYITGLTTSNLFPAVSAFDATFNNVFDAFVTKIASSGTSLAYSTFLGGSNADYGEAIAVQSSGEAVVTGLTNSANFPLNAPVMPILNGGTDAFVTKFSFEGNTIGYSTFIGGSDDDEGKAVALDKFGNACVTGSTLSPGFPRINSYDSTANGGYDAFAIKLSDAADLAQIQLSPTSLAFDAEKDKALPASKTFSITNGKPLTQVLKWYASDDQPWMVLSHDSGQTNSKTVTVSINTTALTPGIYTGTITVSSPNADNSPQTISVTYEVWLPIAPVVLVHGLASDSTVWNTMKTSLLTDGYDYLWPVTIDACGAPADSLFTSSPQYLFRGCAQNLASFITSKFNALPANKKLRVRQYQFVGHGTGGLVIRRYLSPTGTDTWTPVSASQVIMLGTPNDGLGILGDKTKLYSCSGPVTREIHTRRMLLFNSFFTDGLGVGYHAIWGTGGCSSGGSIQPGCGGWRKLASRFLDCANDGLVPASSVASQGNGGIDRFDQSFGVSACFKQLPTDNLTYTNYITPILQGNAPAPYGNVVPVQPQIGYQFDSTLSAGATKSGSFVVESNTAATIFLFASSPSVQFSLTSPSSANYDSTSTLPDSSIIWVTDSLGIRGFYIASAAVGTWQWTVNASAASSPVTFSLVESIDNAVKINKWQNLVYPLSTDTLKLMVTAKAGATRVTGLTVSATPIYNDSTFGAPFNLLDNGSSGDSSANDGVYGKVIPSPDSGLHRYNITVTGAGPLGALKRHLTISAYVSGTACLCGNVDGSFDGNIDISDLSRLIDFLYISLSPLACMRAANVDGSPDGSVDISDLSALIAYLYLSGPAPNCP